MADTYVVTAPLVVVTNSEQAGRKEYLYAGSELPSYVGKADRDRLVEEGYAAKVGSDDAEAVSPSTSPEQLNTEVLVPLPAGRSVDEQPAPKPAVKK